MRLSPVPPSGAGALIECEITVHVKAFFSMSHLMVLVSETSVVVLQVGLQATCSGSGSHPGLRRIFTGFGLGLGELTLDF